LSCVGGKSARFWARAQTAFGLLFCLPVFSPIRSPFYSDWLNNRPERTERNCQGHSWCMKKHVVGKIKIGWEEIKE
jgi:hypothetical protein